MALSIGKNGFIIPKTISDYKSKKYEIFCVSNLVIWLQRCVARVWQLLVTRRVLSGNKKVASLTQEHVVFFSNYIKPGILQLSIRSAQRNLSIVFIFVSCGEKNFYLVFSEGQYGLDCRSVT